MKCMFSEKYSAAMKSLAYSLLIVAIWFVVMPAQSEQLASDSSRAVAAVLDDFHDAADKGDKQRYLGHFTAGGVFMGTDDWERWPLPAFREYVDSRFQDGKGWSYHSVERHISFSVAGDTAWFDEITESEKWGRFRGAGVLVLEGNDWKIAHYAMSFLLPNEVWPEATKLAQDALKKRAEEQ